MRRRAHVAPLRLRDLIQWLKRNGYTAVERSGSRHQHYRRDEWPEVWLPLNPADDVPIVAARDLAIRLGLGQARNLILAVRQDIRLDQGGDDDLGSVGAE